MSHSDGAFRFLSNLFAVICIAATVFFMVYCTIQYCKNDDSSVVNFAEYNRGKDNIYPGVTLCFSEYFKPETFSDNKMASKFEKIVYKDLIEGNTPFESKQRKLAYLKVLENAKSKQEASENTKTTNTESVETTQRNKEEENPTKDKKGNGRNANNAAKATSRKERSTSDDTKRNTVGKSRPGASFSEDLTNEQEDIVSNFTRKMENLYESNDVININDFMLFGTMATYQPGLRVYHYPSKQSLSNTTWVPTFYPSFSSPRKRCWTFDIPYKPMEKIVSYGVMLNKSIFAGSDPPNKRPPYKKFEIRLSYPGQQLTSPSVESNWGKKGPKTEYTMKFEIQNILVMKRRNKFGENCEIDWNQNDKILINKMLEDIECTLPHWMINTTYPICQGEQLKKIGHMFYRLRHNTPPCQTIEKILYTYEEAEGLENYDETIAESKKQLGIRYEFRDIFQIMLTFQGTTYMEITQIRAYDGQSLIGNAGGYVGLFLGSALIQLPSAIQYFFNLARKLFGEK